MTIDGRCNGVLVFAGERLSRSASDRYLLYFEFHEIIANEFDF
jgi:hypothetical protein